LKGDIRRLIKKYIEVLILDELSKKELHGYGFIELIRERYGFAPSPSMIYPVLKDLMRRGLIEASERFSGSKKVIVYRITDEGLKFLRDNEELLKQARKHEERIRRACEAGIFEVLKVIKELFEVIDSLGEQELARIRAAIEEFAKAIHGVLRSASHE